MKIIALILISACLCAAENAAQNLVIQIAPDATLTISYNNFGTKSEGQTGKLVINGKEVAGKEGETKIVGNAELKYYPESAEKLWAPKAWNYSDRSLIKYSWQR